MAEEKVTQAAEAAPPKAVEETAETVAARLAVAREADIFFFNGQISESMFGKVVERISERKYRNTLLILVTLGGDANAGYRIARIFQSTSREFTVFLPSYCKSAGTLVALGAHRLIMSPFAELGPLDVQLIKMDELGERRSGLTTRSALDSLNAHAMDLFSEIMLGIKERSGGRVRFRTAADLAAQLAIGLLAPVYGQVDPVAMGEDHRDLHVALDYGRQLARYAKNATDDTVWKLVHDYPSHDYVIDYHEARTMFKRVDRADDQDLYKLIALLGDKAFQPLKDGVFQFLSKIKDTAATGEVSSTNEGRSHEDTQQTDGDGKTNVVRI